MPRLSDKIAIVTGAARGIGAAIARAYIDEGAQVCLTDILDELGTSVADDLGPNAFYLRLDVRQERDWTNVVSTVLDRFGKLDVLANIAGITGFEGVPACHDPENTSLEDWRAVHATNLDGVFLGCKHAIRAMRRTRSGSIINMSSRSGLVGIPGAAAYASSKAAVRNHSKSVAIYCAEQGLAIRCSSLHPGGVLTPMWDHLLRSGSDRENNLKAWCADVPLRRWGKAEEIAAVAVLLASDEATYITGAEINIHGGVAAGTVSAMRGAPDAVAGK